MPRRRLMLVFAICLFSGAILTVLTSWACAALPFTARIGRYHSVESRFDLKWPLAILERWPPPRFLVHDGALGRRYVTAIGSSDPHHYSAEVAEFGLPLPAMRWSWHKLSSLGLQAIGDPTVHAGLPLPSLNSDRITGQTIHLPLRPIPLGFAANTLIYAAALAGLITLTRRLRRTRPGLCPRCRYDLTGNPTATCPECGPERAS